MNAGTIEFLMDEDRSLHFIEMNTRIQVEHPVTEMVTDVDLVKSQIMIAAGAKMERRAARARSCIAAMPSSAASMPSIRKSSRLRQGRLPTFNPPGGTGVRMDTAAYAEGVIPPYYDSLIAKLIVRGKDRNEAISRMSRALEMFIVEGIYTTIPLHRQDSGRPGFSRGELRYGFIERFLAKTGNEEAAAKCGEVLDRVSVTSGLSSDLLCSCPRLILPLA